MRGTSCGWSGAIGDAPVVCRSFGVISIGVVGMLERLPCFDCWGVKSHQCWRQNPGSFEHGYLAFRGWKVRLS